MKQVDGSVAPALQNGLRIMEMVVESSLEGVGFNAISSALGVSNATTSRLLSVLRSRGYVVKESGTGRYRPGPRMSLINNSLPVIERLRQILPDILEELVEAVSNTCLFIFWNGREMQCLDKRTHECSVPMQPVGNVDPDVTGGPWGWLFLNSAEGDERLAIERRIKRKLDYKPVFKRWSAFYDEHGFCYDDQELYTPLRRLAARVVDRSGKTIGALAIGGNPLTIADGQVLEYGEILKRVAAKLAESL